MTLVDLALYGAMPILALAFLLTLVRLVRGPGVPNRVIALDLLAVISIGMIAAYSIATNQTAFIDVTIVLAILSFLSTVAFARYVERSR